MNRVIPFPIDPGRESDRLQAIHSDHLDLDNLAATLGSPEEWLTTAILHLKSQVSEGNGIASGVMPMSTAAVSLVLYRLEELEQRGVPWQGHAA